MSVRKEILGRGIGFPFAFDNASGGVAMSEYEENIRQSITIILGTRPGERQMLPDFGCRIHELLFAPNTEATSHMAARFVEESLRRWESRIDVVEVNASPDASGSLRLEVVYKVISTGAIERLHHVVSNTR